MLWAPTFPQRSSIPFDCRAHVGKPQGWAFLGGDPVFQLATWVSAPFLLCGNYQHMSPSIFDPATGSVNSARGGFSRTPSLMGEAFGWPQEHLNLRTRLPWFDIRFPSSRCTRWSNQSTVAFETGNASLWRWETSIFFEPLNGLTAVGYPHLRGLAPELCRWQCSDKWAVSVSSKLWTSSMHSTSLDCPRNL